MLNSRFADNFLIISVKPNQELVSNNKLHNIYYITPPISSKDNIKDEFVANWNLSSTISRADYAKAVVAKIQTLTPKLIEVENDFRLAGFLAKKLPNIPVILIPHVPIAKRKFFSRLRQYLHYLKPIREFIFVSNNHKKHFFYNFGYSKKSSNVIHNSYAHITPVKTAFSCKNNTIIFAGRATILKGYREFILGCLPVLKQFVDWKAIAVLSVETISEREAVDNFMNQPHIQHYINTGQLQIIINLPNQELFQLFTSAKIAVFPTHPAWIEGIPLVGLEAHAAKCAVIASANPGFQELSGDNILYIESVTPTEIAKKISYLIEHPNIMQNLAEEGLNNILTNYDIKELVKLYDDVRAKYV